MSHTPMDCPDGAGRSLRPATTLTIKSNAQRTVSEQGHDAKSESRPIHAWKLLTKRMQRDRDRDPERDRTMTPT